MNKTKVKHKASKGKPTIITCENLTAAKVNVAFNNPAGFISDNSPQVRKALAKKTREIISELHKERKSKSI